MKDHVWHIKNPRNQRVRLRKYNTKTYENIQTDNIHCLKIPLFTSKISVYLRNLFYNETDLVNISESS